MQRLESVEGFDKVQEAQLRSRKKLVGAEEQRWKELFLIMFSDDDEDTIPSPRKSMEENLCSNANQTTDYDTDIDLTGRSDQLAEYDRYLARELPAWSGLSLKLLCLGRRGHWRAPSKANLSTLSGIVKVSFSEPTLRKGIHKPLQWMQVLAHPLWMASGEVEESGEMKARLYFRTSVVSRWGYNSFMKSEIPT
jgi:hypothetical protein